jgi:dihydrolipoamide dehydrogenase
MTHDLIVIGGGPGGYVAAIRAAQLGLNVACVEKEPALGGTCLRVGCIPSKAMLESSEKYHEAKEELQRHGVLCGEVTLDLETMLRRKEQVVGALTKGIDGLLKKNKVTRYLGHGKITDSGRVTVDIGGELTELESKHIIIATGSKVARLRGVELDGVNIVTSAEALGFTSVPRHLVVIGAGVIGLELGSVWQRLGAKVTVLEYLNRILPGMDSDLAGEAQKIFERQGMEFRLGAKVLSARVEGGACVVECDGVEPILCDRVLLAVGRVHNTDNLGLDSVRIDLDSRGRIPVDERFETSAKDIYAIGDVIRGPMLAHKAEEDGAACVEAIVNGSGHVDYNAIPGVVYTHPEVACVGKTEDELKASNVAYKTGRIPFLANGRARAMGQTQGFVKVLADASTDRLLGVHIIGPRAGDLIAEAALAVAQNITCQALGNTSHAHPSLSEMLKEAALAANGRAIHF